MLFIIFECVSELSFIFFIYDLMMKKEMGDSGWKLEILFI